MRILLVEDEPRAAQMLAKGLREEAYAVDVVSGDPPRQARRSPVRCWHDGRRQFMADGLPRAANASIGRPDNGTVDARARNAIGGRLP